MHTHMCVSGMPARTVKHGRFSAVAYMSLANALHFGAYELARSAIMALFTSNRTGFASTVTLTLATGLVSPFAVVLLYVHQRVFERHGPRRSLLYTTMAYALSIFITAVVLRWCSGDSRRDHDGQSNVRKRIAQCCIVAMFVAKNAFVQLLTAQHWSFLTTVLSSSSDQGAKWTPVIAGIASVAATAAGFLVSPLVGWLSQRQRAMDGGFTESNIISTRSSNDGLTGLLLIAAAIMMLTSYCSDKSYRIAQEVCQVACHAVPCSNTPVRHRNAILMHKISHSIFLLDVRTTLHHRVKEKPKRRTETRPTKQLWRLLSCNEPCDSFNEYRCWVPCAWKF